MAIPQDEYCVRIVANRVLAMLADDADEQWENYPEIGEHDWKRVVERVHRLVAAGGNPSHDVFDSAYAFLARRAEDDS